MKPPAQARPINKPQQRHDNTPTTSKITLNKSSTPRPTLKSPKLESHHKIDENHRNIDEDHLKMEEKTIKTCEEGDNLQTGEKVSFPFGLPPTLVD